MDKDYDVRDDYGISNITIENDEKKRIELEERALKSAELLKSKMIKEGRF